MLNPFDVLLTRFDELESKLSSLTVQPAEDKPELINRFELCQRLGITEAHAIRLGKKGQIPEIRIGSSVRYNWPKVIEALETKTGAA